MGKSTLSPGYFNPVFTAATLTHLARLVKLENLHIQGPELIDTGLDHFTRITGTGKA